MSRAPLPSPMLDQIAAITLTDLTPAKVRLIQRADAFAHALMSEWGGPGVYVPLHLDDSDTPDDHTLPLPVPPGIEYYDVAALVSYGTTKGAAGEVVLTSAATAASCTITFQEVAIEATLEGAVIAFSDVPLQVRSGVNWEPSVDTVTVVFDQGSGVVWGLLFVPIYVPQ